MLQDFGAGAGCKARPAVLPLRERQPEVRPGTLATESPRTQLLPLARRILSFELWTQETFNNHPVNKWAPLTVLVLVAGAVAASGIYTWGWQGNGADQRAKATLFASELVAYAQDKNACKDCRLLAVTEVADDQWIATLLGDGKQTCMAIDLRYFRRTKDSYSGAARVACPRPR